RAVFHDRSRVGCGRGAEPDGVYVIQGQSVVAGFPKNFCIGAFTAAERLEPHCVHAARTPEPEEQGGHECFADIRVGSRDKQAAVEELHDRWTGLGGGPGRKRVFSGADGFLKFGGDFVGVQVNPVRVAALDQKPDFGFRTRVAEENAAGAFEFRLGFADELEGFGQ
ncbi:MAG: hypothetical protein RLZZ253_1377, partial [Verrucomicrobiota bacterium]